MEKRLEIDSTPPKGSLKSLMNEWREINRRLASYNMSSEEYDKGLERIKQIDNQLKESSKFDLNRHERIR